MLLNADGFDHYGSVSALLLQGGYAAASLVTISSANPRTGARHLRIVGAFDNGLRYVAPAAVDTLGIGFAFFIPALPTNSTSLCLCSLRDEDNAVIASIMVTSTGALRVTNGVGNSGDTLTTGPICVVPGSYQHFEVRATQGTGGLSLECRINGVTELNAPGLDVTLEAEIAQAQIGTSGQGVFGFPAYLDVDDFFAWDGEGSENNDFIGDKKAYTGFPTADGADQDWAPSVGSDGFAMLDNVPPLDATEYLSSDVGGSGGDRSTFGIADFPAEIVSIAGVVVKTRIFKSDAGDAKATVGVISSATEDTGEEHALNISPRWFDDVFEVDPATGLPWTLAGLNAVQTVLTRTE